MTAHEKMICEREYVTQRGYNCLLSCIYNYLFFCNDVRSEADLFLKSRGYRLYGKRGRFPTYKIADTLKKMALPAKIKRVGKGKDAREELLKMVKEDRMIILCTQANKLKYNNVFQYIDDSMGHFFNVIGADAERFYISDGYINTNWGSLFEGYVDYEDFAEAWETYENCKYIELDSKKLPGKAYKSSYFDPARFIREYTSSNCIMLKTYRREISEMRLCADEKEAEKKAWNFNLYLRSNGSNSVRNYIIEMMKKNMLCDIKMEEYMKISTEWNRVSLMFVKLTRGWNIEYLEQIASKIEKLFDEENKILRALENAL